jgi:hypothetical protein
MGRFTSTLALVVVLAGLGAYIYFVDSRRPAGGIEEKAKVFAVEADKIEQLTLTASGETSVLQKKDGTWTMTTPAATDADQTEVNSLTSNLATLEVNRVVDENPTDLSGYGLAKPKVHLSFKGQNNVAGELAIGDTTPTAGDVYAMKPGEKRVFLLSSFTETTFNKKPFDLRDKRILKFERDKADMLQLSQGATVTEFARAGSDWKVARPMAVRADYSAVEGFLTKLSSASMSKLIENDAKDLTKYGLDKPTAVIVIGAGSNRATLEVGKTEKEDTYARDAARPGLIFTLDTTLAGDVKKGVDDYRKKDLFEFRPFNADQLRIVRDTGAVYQLEKVRGAGGAADKWRITAPGSPARDAQETQADELLTKLSTARASTFADAKTRTGLDKPILVVGVSYDAGKFERVRLGKAGADDYGSHDGEPGAGKLDAGAIDGMLKALEAVATPPPPPPANATPAATNATPPAPPKP